MKTVAYVAVLVALFAAAGARDLQQAPAPAPATAKPTADLIFVLSAEKASFPTTNTLQLKGVSTTVQYYGAGAKAGIVSTQKFANSSAGADYVASNGEWLNVPDAVLFSNSGSSNQAILLSLEDPVYNKEDKSVTFEITVLPADEAALKTAHGVTNELVQEHANNVGTPLTDAVVPGAVWNDVALFIDQNKMSLKPLAATESYHWWGGNSCGWGGCGGSGWGGWGSGYNSGWGSSYNSGWGSGWGK